MNTKIKKLIAVPLTTVLAFQLSACGTILFPERKGQNEGPLDVSVVVLDAIGLLFYLIPGVIAFAVDFNNGTIYLPGGSASINTGEINIVKIEGGVTDEKVEQIIMEQAGTIISLGENEVLVSEKSITLNDLEREIRFL